MNRARNNINDDECLNKESHVISAMFNNIAHRYDLLNHLFSFGVDKYWRKKAVKYLLSCKRADNKSYNVLDIACGTGDSSIALYKKGFNVIGIDIAAKMIDIAQKKAGNNIPSKSHCIYFEKGNAERLKYADCSFNAVTVFFGIRNFDKREECLKEIYRVTEKGGTLAILEFAKPRQKAIKYFYNLYLNGLMPIIGKIVSKDKSAYRYLSASIDKFPKYDTFCKEIGNAGFKNVEYRSYTLGISVLYTGMKI